MMPPVDEVLDHCYRHPDRETALSCSNCGRAICPDCMTATPVGQRCPECIGRQRVLRPASMAFVAPVVTYALIAACVLVFIGPQGGLSAGLVGGGRLNSSMFEYALYGPAIADEPWRLVSSMFMHASLLHLGFNMYALYAFGPALEARYGRARFLGLYLAAGLFGSAGALLLDPDKLTVGASGAIFGLMGAYVAIARARGLPDLGGLGGVLAVNLIVTFLIPGISIGGHIGGLAGGLAAGFAYEMIGHRLRGRSVQVAGLAAVGAIALVAIGLGLGFAGGV
jgi:membrane associated rhomboid family serine protease